MGRKNKSYAKDLHQQAYERLVGMQAFGESKREAVAQHAAQDKIFSYNTYRTYYKHVKYFLRYIQSEYPDCTTLRVARRYVNEWLELRENQGLSAWTVQTEAKALGKLYGITPEDPDYFQPPQRHRAEIKRSRGVRVRDAHFSETNHDELIRFCRGTGVRRSELERLRGGDLMSREEITREKELLEQVPAEQRTAQEMRHLEVLTDTELFDCGFFIHVRSGKGGRERLSPILGRDAERIIRRMEETAADERVWQYIHSNADIHSYRAEYATAIYKAHARPIETIPYDRVNRGTGKLYQSEVYVCRKDEVGKRLDKRAMLLCSKALGHNRLEIVANNYIRAL